MVNTGWGLKIFGDCHGRRWTLRIDLQAFDGEKAYQNMMDL